MIDCTVHNGLQNGMPHEKEQPSTARFVPKFYAMWSAVCVIRGGLAAAIAASLFRPTLGNPARMSSGIGSGVGAVFGVVEAAYTARIFIKEQRADSKIGKILKATEGGRDRASVGIKPWHAELNECSHENVAQYSKRVLREKRAIEAHLRDGLETEKAIREAAELKKTRRTDWLSFLRDGVFQLAGSGNTFAGIVKNLIFHGAHVKIAAIPFVGAAVGIVGSGGHIAAGVHARREANAAQAACDSEMARIDVVLTALEECGADKEKIAAFLARPGGGKSGLGYGKLPVSVAEAEENARASARAANEANEVNQVKEGNEEKGPVSPPRGNSVATPPAATLPAASPMPATAVRPDPGIGRETIPPTPSADCPLHGTSLTRRFLARVKNTRQEARAKAGYDASVATARIVYGTFGVALNSLALALQASGVGTLPGLLLAFFAPVVQMALAAAWTGFASYRIGRSQKEAAAAQACDGADKAAGTVGVEVGAKENGGVKARELASADNILIDEIMTLLQDRSAGATLARKLLKKTLREHGVSRLALQLMKFGAAHGHKMDNQGLCAEAADLVRAQVRDLVTGDGAPIVAAEQAKGVAVVEGVSAPSFSCGVSLA